METRGQNVDAGVKLRLGPRLEISRESAHMQSMKVLVVLAVVIVFAGVPFAALAAPTLVRLRRRQRIARRPFPAAWRDNVRRRVPLVRELPPA